MAWMRQATPVRMLTLLRASVYTDNRLKLSVHTIEGASLPELVNRTVEVTSTEWPAMLESTSFSVNIAANSNRMFGKYGW